MNNELINEWNKKTLKQRLSSSSNDFIAKFLFCIKVKTDLQTEVQLT